MLDIVVVGYQKIEPKNSIHQQETFFYNIYLLAAVPSNTLHICVPKSKFPLKRLD